MTWYAVRVYIDDGSLEGHEVAAWSGDADSRTDAVRKMVASREELGWNEHDNLNPALSASEPKDTP